MVPKVDRIGIQEQNFIFCRIIVSIKNLPTDVDCDDRIKAITLDRIRHFENWKLSKFIKIQKFFSKVKDFGMFGKSSRALGKKARSLSQTTELSFCSPGLPRNKLGKNF